MEPEVVIGCFVGGCFQNSSEYGTRNKSLRFGKSRAVDFELTQDLIGISTLCGNGLEQSRRGDHRNHRSCHHDLRPRQFLVLQMSAWPMGALLIQTNAVTAERNNAVSRLAGSSADLIASC